ncbi:MAG: hypothetical protein CMI63_00835 [Parvularcula sp.]|uniref:hypothetical protein n=1 Tax=Hyphococcus sp. TaxID=2038636 RepID=UPI000C46A81F|nr:hypothetical protein [Parvularcula sp.]
MKPFPIHFAIDLEPDERLPDEANKSFDSAGVALERMLSLRSEIEAATGFPAAFGWYIRMDRHVTGLYGDAGVIAVRYKSLLDEAAQAGDEIGLHIHANERGPDGRWRANYADEEAVLRNVDDAFASFQEVFGRTCRSVRMGDMWTSKACLRRLYECGALYDLTLESGRRPRSFASVYPGTGSKGWRPSMVGAPLAPYQPDRKDMPGFWVAPLASYPRSDFHNPRMLLLSAYSGVATGFRRRRARQMLRPQDYYPRETRKAWIEAALAEGEQPGFCFAIRNFGDAAQIEQFLDVLMEIAKERPLKFCAPADYISLATA